MSVEQAKAFFAKVKEDSELAQKLKDAQANYTGDKDAAVAAVVLPIAAAAGFNFTVDDFKAAFTVNDDEGEISDDELDAVAGGAFDASKLGNLLGALGEVLTGMGEPIDKLVKLFGDSQ